MKVQAQFSKSLKDTEFQYRKLLTSQDTFGTSARKLRAQFMKLGGDAREYGTHLKEIQAKQANFDKAWQGADKLALQFDKLLNSTDRNVKKAKELIQAVRNEEVSFAEAQIQLRKYNLEWTKTARRSGGNRKAATKTHSTKGYL